MLNAKNLPSNTSTKKSDPLEPGTYPARLVGVVLLGIQPQRPYKGEEKPPKLMFRLTYEFLDEFLKDEDGNDIEDKPRWLSEELPFMSLKADLAKSTKRYFALDPDSKADGDWEKLVGSPCMVTVVNEADKRPGIDRIYEKITSVSSMRPKEAAKAPELKNDPIIFDFYSPDVELFKSFPEWIQDKIKGAVDFPGSDLEKLLEGDTGAASKDVPKKDAKRVSEELKVPDNDEDDEDESW